KLQMFHETSAESFEQSLMQGKYASVTPEFSSAAPPHQLRPADDSDRYASHRDDHTLYPKHFQPPPPARIDPITAAREHRKCRRLAAFDRPPSRTPLCPVFVEGLGRVILDADPEVVVVTERQQKRRRAGAQVKPLTARPSADRVPDVDKWTRDARELGATDPLFPHASLPDWPDAQYPWRMRREEREDLHRKEKCRRMEALSRYLE
ncbi:hypothetical protein FISHEDRAFT_14014, partial [Fistulina hepatica ATCC 64428]